MAKPRAALVIAFAALAVVASAPGCGNRPTPPPADKKDAAPADAPAVVEVDAAPLGLADFSAFRWRKRGGQPAFRLARKAEERDDWAAVVAACRQALAADPGHLEAAWLLAVGLARVGKTDQVLAPLQQAAAGDFVKWGEASLERPALQAFLATPVGEAWRRRVEQDRARLVAAIARAAIVTAGGELYAVDVDAGRWYRLSQSAGRAIGGLAVPATHRIAYVSRARSGKLGIGVIDLLRGKSSGSVPLGTAGPITLAYSAKPPVGFWVGAGASRPGSGGSGGSGARGAPPAPGASGVTTWRQLDDEYRLHALPPRTARPSGPWLSVTAKGSVRLHALTPDVIADWDDQSLASAIRIGTSNRVVSVPSPGLIDGNTAAWSPDRVHFAFVAQLDDHCAPGAVNTAAFVVAATTGGTRELERAAGGIALQWFADRKVMIAGDHGVAIRNLDDGASLPIEGATGLLIPRERPRCAPPEPDTSPDGALDDALPEDSEAPEPVAPGTGDEPMDAGVGDAH